jgi:hypothetical protein
MKTDYEKGLEVASELPKFYLGQEVHTKFGNGIIVELKMPSNGLYIEPDRAYCVVWYGVDEAVERSTGWSQFTFRLNEISPLDPNPLRKSQPMPSDEEIEKGACDYAVKINQIADRDLIICKTFIEGAKWMRNKLQSLPKDNLRTELIKYTDFIWKYIGEHLLDSNGLKSGEAVDEYLSSK